MSEFYEKVWVLIKKIPEGRVTTYGELAKALDTRAYQAVGNACRNNPHAPEVPCHRVVKSSGKIGGFAGHLAGENIKRKICLLESEGVNVENGKIVDFDKRLFKFE